MDSPRNTTSPTISRNEVSGVPTKRTRLVKAVFLVDGFGYLTALARLELSGRRDYTDRNLIKK